MGRKDAARFLKLEKQVKMIEMTQNEIIDIQNKIIKRWQGSLIQLRDLLNRLIEDE